MAGIMCAQRSLLFMCSDECIRGCSFRYYAYQSSGVPHSEDILKHIFLFFIFNGPQSTHMIDPSSKLILNAVNKV